MSRLLTFALALVATTASAQDATTRVYRNVTIQRGDGSEPIPDGSIVIRGEALLYAGPSAGAPAAAGAEVIELEDGAVATPGLVAVGAPLGLVEIELEAATMDAAPEDDDADSVRAAFSAAEGYNPDSTLIPVTRLGGITAAVSTPTGGLVSGVSAYVHLGEVREPEALVGTVRNAAAALHVDLGDGGIAATEGTMPTALSRFREVLEDAKLYGTQRRAYERRGLREMRVSRQDLERLQPALAGDVPVVVSVSRAADILRVLAIAEEFGLDLILSGAEEGWRVA